MERPHRLLFVCSGNICRSPMAEGLARSLGGRQFLPLEVRSAGTLQIFDRPADPKAVAVCDELGIELHHHRSQGVSPELVTWADHVLVMEFQHAAWLREHTPEVGEKIVLLGTLIGQHEIADPIGGWRFTFRAIRKELEQAVAAFLYRLPS